MWTVGIADELGNGCSPTCSTLLIVSTLGRLGDDVHYLLLAHYAIQCGSQYIPDVRSVHKGKHARMRGEAQRALQRMDARMNKLRTYAGESATERYNAQ